MRPTDPPTPGSVPCYGGSVRGAGTTFCAEMQILLGVLKLEFERNYVLPAGYANHYPGPGSGSSDVDVVIRAQVDLCLITCRGASLFVRTIEIASQSALLTTLSMLPKVGLKGVDLQLEWAKLWQMPAGTVNMDSSMGKMCLGKDVIEISSDRNEGSGDWDLLEYKDTARSGGKKEPKALVFHKIDTEEDSDWYIAQCFMNVLYASDGEINLEKNDNLISNDYAVKLCLEYKVRKGNNDEEGKPNLDDLKMLLDFDFDEIPQTETDLPPMVCKMGKGSRNKKKVMENIMYFNNGAGPSSSIGIPLTQEEAEKRSLAHNISMRYEILEEVRPVIEALAYNDKYRKLLDEIWADKVRLDLLIKPEEEKAMAKMKG
ncbi:hypothetical protein Tco_0299355 [Tanacetum coccineum]